MLYSFVFHCNFSNPNRITKQSKSRNRRLCDFLWYGVASKARFRKRRRITKNGICASRSRFASFWWWPAEVGKKPRRGLIPTESHIKPCNVLFINYLQGFMFILHKHCINIWDFSIKLLNFSLTHSLMNLPNWVSKIQLSLLQPISWLPKNHLYPYKDHYFCPK